MHTVALEHAKQPAAHVTHPPPTGYDPTAQLVHTVALEHAAQPAAHVPVHRPATGYKPFVHCEHPPVANVEHIRQLAPNVMLHELVHAPLPAGANVPPKQVEHDEPDEHAKQLAPHTPAHVLPATKKPLLHAVHAPLTFEHAAQLRPQAVHTPADG